MERVFYFPQILWKEKKKGKKKYSFKSEDESDYD